VQRFQVERSHLEIPPIIIIHFPEWASQATMRGMMDRHRHIALCGLAALAVAMGIGRFAFTPILPMMQQDAGLTLAQGGWLASANYVGYLAGALTAVALPMGPARTIRLGLALVALSTLAMGVTCSMIAWLALRFVAGAASAWVLVFTSAWCLEQFQHGPVDRRALLGATVFAGVGFGIAIAGAACVVLLIQGVTSGAAWIVLGVLALAMSAVLWKRVGGEASLAPPAETARSGWNGEFVRMVFCYGAFGFGYIIPATFLSAMAREALPDPALYGWSWPLFGAAAAVSTFAAAALRRKWSDRAIWILGHLAMAAGVAIPLVARGMAGILVSALLVGGTFMVVTMAGIQEARRVAGARARQLIAAMTSAFAAGQIAGPLAVAALAAQNAGYEISLALAAALLVASAIALAFRSRTKEST
jgi:predicted MFS family arabinose efflux permease